MNGSFLNKTYKCQEAIGLSSFRLSIILPIMKKILNFFILPCYLPLATYFYQFRLEVTRNLTVFNFFLSNYIINNYKTNDVKAAFRSKVTSQNGHLFLHAFFRDFFVDTRQNGFCVE